MSEDEQEEWKNKYLAKGLPEGLLDEMIAEANAEYEAQLGWSPYDRYAMLTVKVTDEELKEGEFYIYLVQRANEIFQGHACQETEWLFAQIPTVEIVVEVYKLLYDGDLTVKGFGWHVETFTKDTEVNVTIEPYEKYILVGYVIVKAATMTVQKLITQIDAPKTISIQSSLEVSVA